MMNDKITPTKIEIQKVKPQYIAQVCPRCNGYKTLSYGKYPCTLCNETGFLKIPVEEAEE